MAKRGERTRRDGGEDDAANALIESSPQIAIDTARRDICIPTVEFWGLDSGLDGIQWVDKKIDGKSSKSPS